MENWLSFNFPSFNPDYLYTQIKPRAQQKNPFDGKQKQAIIPARQTSRLSSLLNTHLPVLIAFNKYLRFICVDQ